MSSFSYFRRERQRNCKRYMNFLHRGTLKTFRRNYGVTRVSFEQNLRNIRQGEADLHLFSVYLAKTNSKKKRLVMIRALLNSLPDEIKSEHHLEIFHLSQSIEGWKQEEFSTQLFKRYVDMAKIISIRQTKRKKYKKAQIVINRFDSFFVSNYYLELSFVSLTNLIDSLIVQNNLSEHNNRKFFLSRNIIDQLSFWVRSGNVSISQFKEIVSLLHSAGRNNHVKRFNRLLWSALIDLWQGEFPWVKKREEEATAKYQRELEERLFEEE